VSGLRVETVDVLVAGGGGAGLRAAIACREVAPNLRVVVAVKGALGDCGVTATARSDRMAFHCTLPWTEPGGADNWKFHADDVYRLGGRVSDGRLAELQALRSAEAFEYLARLGVPWATAPDGRPEQFVTDGSAYARACHVGPDTAIEIEKALVARARELQLETWENTALVRLFERGGECAGALLARGADEPVLVRARATILATGGPGRLFASSVYPPGMTAEAAAAALDAGGELVNLEFIQMGLCSVKTGLACSGTLMRAVPRLVDEAGRDVLATYLADLSPDARQDLVFGKGSSWPVSYEDPCRELDIACAIALRSGRVYLDYSRDPEGFDARRLLRRLERWPLEAERLVRAGDTALLSPLSRLAAMNPAVVERLRSRGADLASGDRLEIAHCVQHFQGGVRIGPDASTALAGLYACGEAAGGQHGANRPGGNALLDCQVFGRIAGESAAARALAGAGPAADPGLEREAAEWVAAARSISAADAERAMERVTALCDRACGVVRTGGSLRAALEELRGLARTLVPREGARGGALLRAAEALGNLLFAEALLESALAREESRGSHLRFDAEPSAGARVGPRLVPRDDSRPPLWTLVRRVFEANPRRGPILRPGRLVLRREVAPGLSFELRDAGSS